MPTTATNFFIDCPTIEKVKNRYQNLAKKYHPDLGGDTVTMQFINAEYAEAMRRAIPSEENEYRREQASAGFESLREAIEFAVTLPENISATIRGFWLWHEGETYLCKDQVKLFESTDRILPAGRKTNNPGILAPSRVPTNLEKFIPSRRLKPFTDAKKSTRGYAATNSLFNLNIQLAEKRR